MSGYKVLIPSTDPARASAMIDGPATSDDNTRAAMQREQTPSERASCPYETCTGWLAAAFPTGRRNGDV
jgi:hypothetical protein